MHQHIRTVNVPNDFPHKTYYPQASMDLALLPRQAEQLAQNPLYEMSQPQDAEDTFFHKEPPCQIHQTHLELDAILYFMQKCRRQKKKTVITRSMPRDHLADPYLKAEAKILMLLLSNLAQLFLQALPTTCVWTMHVKKATVKLDNKIIMILLSSVGG